MVMNKTSATIMFICSVFLTSLAFAHLKANLYFKKTASQLQIKSQISNNENVDLHFKLKAQTQLQQISGFTSNLNPDGSMDLLLKAQQIGQIQYLITLPSTNTAPIYIAGDENWIPTLTGSQTSNSVQTQYIVSADMPPDYQLIHSATGHPQDELAFVICKCRKYSGANGKLNIFLLKDEPELAQTLLSTLETYLNQFEKQFGHYPYDQFSVVESPDEIGYAFPKMTWIGSQLLHFPFILKTSLPHELLHSWWGNGVFVDPGKGNWCEGLTTFGADYGLLPESDKKIYRVKAITNFLNYSRGTTEIPLSQFSSRGEDRSLQAIGYDKALMVFIMLETRVGKTVFNQALQEFYKKYRFKKASFEDFFSVLSQTSKLDFTEFKKFWLYSKGLLPKEVLKLSWQENPNQLVFETPNPSALKTIAGLPLNILALMPDQTVKSFNQKVRDDGKGLELKVAAAPVRPLSYTFDQDFLLLRELSASEKPVTFSQYFASPAIKVLSGDDQLVTQLDAVFANSKFESITDFRELGTSQLMIVSIDQAVRNADVRAELGKKGLELSPKQFTYQGQTFSLNENSLFVSFKIKQTRMLVVALGSSQTLNRWLQRWSHYGDKSYLILDSKSALTQGVWLEPSPIAL